GMQVAEDELKIVFSKHVHSWGDPGWALLFCHTGSDEKILPDPTLYRSQCEFIGLQGRGWFRRFLR
ncbi:MAG TPA: hypothetical protein VES89_04160, partial [Candidatus Competibacteraceae bacterium]|nr:hypothetical protein [Candidatus Competibacteraceae bacterium]